MISTVRHTGIVVTDMSRSLPFYGDLLQFGQVVLDKEVSNAYVDKLTDLKDARIHIVMLEAPDGSRIELLQYLSHPRQAAGDNESCTVGCSHVALEVDDVDGLYERLRAAGARFHAAPQADPQGSSKVAYCRGPDNEILELVQVLDASKALYATSAQTSRGLA